MMRILIPLLFLGSSTAASLSEVTSYAKVSRNGQTEKEMKSAPTSWIARALSQLNGTERDESEGRSVKDIVITVSPVYIPPKTPKLQNGEAFDYAPVGRYSTLDHEMIAKLNAKKQIQERYHPAPILTHGQSSVKQQSNARPAIRPSPSDSFDFSKPLPDSFDFKPSYLADKPISKPIAIDDYPSSEISDKQIRPMMLYEQLIPVNVPQGQKNRYPCVAGRSSTGAAWPAGYSAQPPDSYKQPEIYYSDHDHGTEFSDFPPDPYASSDVAPKPIEFSSYHDHPPPFEDESFDHDFHHEVIYDHLPEHHKPEPQEPEMNDQRLDKRPYSYYFIGKKLWYVPLYFSIYFIIYIAALVLKSIARHKISLPAHLAEVAGHARKNADSGWWDLTGRVLGGIESFAEKLGKIS